MAMKTNYVLVDFESVQAHPQIGTHLADEHFRLILFMGANQARIDVALAKALQPLGQRVEYVTIGGAGRNALDFHIAYYLGKLAAAQPDAYFHVIAVDKGYDPLLAHLKECGVNAQRWPSISDIPIVKTNGSASADDKLSIIIAYLVRRGPQRPASAKTLKGSIVALFEPKLPEAEAVALIDELERQGVLSVQDNKVTYGLPD